MDVMAEQGEAQRLLLVKQTLKQALAPLAIELTGVDAAFALREYRTDPFDASATLYCLWRDAHGNLLGTVQLHDSGRVFAEYDVLQPHPHKIGWFIESVSAWGSGDALRTELQLLKMP